MHGKLWTSEEELVQQVESGVGLVGLLAGAHQLLYHRAQGKDAVVGVHLVLLEILHVPFYCLDVATHLQVHDCCQYKAKMLLSAGIRFPVVP